VFLVNSRLGLVTATTQKAGREVLFLKWHPFSRSYGANLPSSFTWILSSALGFSPRLRVSVYGTVSLISHIEDFLGSMIRESLWARPSYSCLRIMFRRIYLPELPTHLNPDYQNRDLLSLLNLFSIAYAFRPRLRVRLTLSRLTLLRKPWAYGEPVFHRLYRYSFQHTHFYLLQLPSRVNLRRLIERSSTDPFESNESHSFGMILSPGNYRRRTA